MKDKNVNLFFPLKILALIWISFIIDTVLINVSFCKFGIIPREINGLIGIPISPFIHANIFHIMSNTIPLLILLYVTVIFYKNKTLPALVFIISVGGALVWVFGRHSYHVGASGLIYGLVGFLIFYGIFKKAIVPLIISLLIGITYGTSMFIGLLPIFPGVSWEGHLFGGIAGVIAAKISE